MFASGLHTGYLNSRPGRSTRLKDLRSVHSRSGECIGGVIMSERSILLLWVIITFFFDLSWWYHNSDFRAMVLCEILQIRVMFHDIKKLLVEISCYVRVQCSVGAGSILGRHRKYLRKFSTVSYVELLNFLINFSGNIPLLAREIIMIS